MLKILLQITPIIALFFTSCANPSITNINKEILTARPNAAIYLSRFEGNPDFVEQATDVFATQLQAKTNRHVVQGDALRIESPDIIRGGNIAPRQLGISAAKSAGTDFLIVGKISSHSNGTTLNGFVTVRIIDVKTGNIVATIHRASGLIVAHSEHHCVMTASIKAAKALAPYL